MAANAMSRAAGSESATETVLERAFLPTDAHSFAKYYTGSDVNKLTEFSASVTEITLCNTTYSTSGSSQNSTDAPLIRVAEGDYRYWAANERWQCTWSTERRDTGSGTNTTGSNTSDPVKATVGLGQDDYVARVQVCVDGKVGTEKCKFYGSNQKPTGLLHTYGESGTLEFGLLTGSYAKNKSGGALRQNISDFSTEINTDGTFDSSVNGIVSTIDRLRIARYEYGSGDNDGQIQQHR